MPYIRRDADGRICAVYRSESEPGLEAIEADNPELVAFTEDVMSASWPSSDLSMARVVEDLIDALIERGVIGFTDLPDAARAKIVERRRKRQDLEYLSGIGLGADFATDSDSTS